MKIIFAGTPQFAAVALSALIDAGHEIALALSQPDRPSGRGMKLAASPVKKLALSHGLKVATPETLSLRKAPAASAEMHKMLREIEADVMIVAAYGLILPQPVLDCAKGIGKNQDIKAVNIHASLLPRWRGAAPVSRAIEAGDAETGVTLMKMELGLDAGPMIRIRKTPIRPEDTTLSLTERLAGIGAELLTEALEAPDELDWIPQPEEGATYAEKLLKSESRICWQESAETIARRLRAFTPFPGLHFMREDLAVKLIDAAAAEGSGQPGEVLEAGKRLVVACGEGALEAKMLQRPGKGKMPAQSFLQSLKIAKGEVLQ